MSYRELSPEDIAWCMREARIEVGLDKEYRPPFGWIDIEHPSSPMNTARVREESFEETWEPRGWTKVNYDRL